MTESKKIENVLKVRDDHIPMRFVADGKQFKKEAGESSAWLVAETFGHKELRKGIEPWLTSLFQSEHLSLLVGSGLTHAVHCLAKGTRAAGMDKLPLTAYVNEIDAASDKAARTVGRGNANIEDQLRAANELLRGLEILGKNDDANVLRGDLKQGLITFAKKILESEAGIITAEQDRRDKAFSALVTFLMSFASRTGVRDRLNIFTTNYDRLIEAGAELAGLHLLDRFVGNLMPIFRSSRLDLDMHYNPPGIRGEPRYLEGVARFTKLHGSVDWVQADADIRRIGLPFGAGDVLDYLLNVPGLQGATAHELMIYPNAAKDRETAEYPYVEMFRDLAAAICRPNSTLVTYGYGFGDEHINRVIRDMLTIPSTHLVVISRSDTYGRIQPLADMCSSQVSLLLGPDLADLVNLTEHYLPKAAIDKATSRMSDLLKQRMGVEQPVGKSLMPNGDVADVGDVP